MTGVEIRLLRVRGQTESLGFVSNSQSVSPVSASYPRTQPSPSPRTTWVTPPISPTPAEDHCPCRMFSPTWFCSQTSSPVFLSTAMIAGASGEGMLAWVSSWPLEVVRKRRSPTLTGLAFDMLCGNAPSSSIMSSRQRMSPSFGER